MSSTPAPAHPLPFDHLGAAPTAEQVVDRDAAAVLLDLNPIVSSLLPDIARAISRNVGARQLLADIGTLHPANPRYGYSLGKLQELPEIRQALTVTLALDQAEELGDQLAHASINPPECTVPGCGYLTQQWGTPCDDHGDAR